MIFKVPSNPYHSMIQQSLFFSKKCVDVASSELIRIVPVLYVKLSTDIAMGVKP